MLLHVLAHVDLNQRVLIAEHEFGQRFGKQRLAHTGGSREQEHSGRPLGILQTAATASYGLGNLFDRLLLADNAFMQLVFHLQQANRVFARQTGEWNAGHLGYNFGDDFGIDDAVGLFCLFAPFVGQRLFLFLDLVSLVAQSSGLLEVLVGNRFFLGLVQPFDFLFKLFQVGRPNH